MATNIEGEENLTLLAEFKKNFKMCIVCNGKRKCLRLPRLKGHPEIQSKSYHLEES